MIIEKTIYDYLSDMLSVPVFLERPKDQQTNFVLIERTSGSKQNGLSTATVAIQSHSASMLNAVTLNGAVKQAMEAMISLTNIFSVKLNSDYNFTNQNSFRGYRYQAVFFITYKEN